MKWLKKDRIDIALLIFTKEDELSKIFNEYRFNLTNQLIKNISTSLQKFNFVDDVEKSIDLDPSKFICLSCLNVNEKANKVWNFFDFVFHTLLSRKALYGDISRYHPENPPKIILGEIIGVNPNSYEIIKTVLENLQEQAGVGKEKGWTQVGFDGIPYRIASEIIEHTKLCLLCNEIIEISITSEKDYAKEKHSDCAKVQFDYYYGNILLTAGAGHMEKNLFLALFWTCSPIFIKDVADKLGFKSKAAKEFIATCGDHHLT